MWGIQCGQGEPIVRTDLDEPKPVPGEVSIRVLQAGICETDLQLLKGYMGYRGVLGHEFVGIAESGRWAGQRVVGEINCACQQCEYCRGGMRNHCPYRTVLGILGRDGAFAERISLPEENLHPVPDRLTLDEATLVEPLAAACRIPEQVPIDSSMKIIVLGDGRLGNLCAQVLKHHGGSVTVIGKHPNKLKLIDGYGIPTALLEETIFTREADLVVDCTGSPTGLACALQCVKPRGTIVLKTTVADDYNRSLAPLVIDEVTLIGSRCGPFDKALELLAANAVDVQSLVSARYRLREGAEAFARARQGDTLKVILEIAS